MSIAVTCPRCGAQGKVRRPRPGKRIRCGQCGRPMTLPRLPELEAGAPAPDDAEAFATVHEDAPAVERAFDPDEVYAELGSGDIEAERRAPWLRDEPVDGDRVYDDLGTGEDPEGAARRAARLRRRYLAYAGFWHRFAAFLIDRFLLGLVAGAVGGIVGSVMGSAIAAERGGPPQPEDLAEMMRVMWLLGIVVAYGVGWPYYAFMESSSWQATVGKRVLGLAVLDEHGERVSFLRASVRFWAKLLSGFICLLGYILAAFTPEKQALHDIIAGCLVVRRTE